MVRSVCGQLLLRATLDLSFSIFFPVEPTEAPEVRDSMSRNSDLAMVQAGCFESAEFRNFRALPRSEQLAWQKRHHEKYAIRTPQPYDETLVREFYVALIPTVLYYHNTVFVGRTKVTVTPEAIIDYLQVPVDSDVEYQEGFVVRAPLQGIHGELAASLRRDGDDRWIPGTNDLKYSSLCVDLAVWTLFIKSNIIPSKHHTVLSPDTARCLYSERGQEVHCLCFAVIFLMKHAKGFYHPMVNHEVISPNA
ncbi:hypothetical protein L2E82_35765 [Cichorium intybus]|uniref:Uncharacterized protein n=1 Tax=Cichorium intybus TaxID=13427 RepID=A0ACB9BPQ3_CICIN|nr:hypothetical protein L2E82_35765 [Cichorium intybus]